MRDTILTRKKDPYWKAVAVALAQLDGLHDGYNAAAPETAQLDFRDFLLLNSDGDLESLVLALEETPKGQGVGGIPGSGGSVGVRKRNLRCSAIFKLLPENSDIVFGHATWDHFELLGPRLLKAYKYQDVAGGGDENNESSSSSASATVTSTVEVVMSSSGGFLSSVDDFYLTSKGLAVIETTNGNFNETLWKEIRIETVLSWVRVNVANMLSDTNQGWASSFGHLNSGTYNNQWMILDLKRFTPFQPLQKETFLVLEQLPGLIRSEDMSSALETDRYWGSYNVPYFPEVWSKSGFGLQTPKSAYSHHDCPRANIFRRDHGNVTDLKGIQRLLRYNDWREDPLSLGDACNAISARCDLNPVGHPSYSLDGGLDAKASSYTLAKELRFLAQCGPTHDEQPVWDWAEYQPTKAHPANPVHMAHPTRFGFEWVGFGPL